MVFCPLETGIRAAVPAEIREKGSLVLSARLFGEIIRKMPDDVVVFTAQNYMVNIKCGLSEFNILGTDPEEFPELPAVEQQNSLTMEQALRSMISQTLFAVSDNESRPIHTGSLFEVDQSGLTVVCGRLPPGTAPGGCGKNRRGAPLLLCGARLRPERGGEDLRRRGCLSPWPRGPAHPVPDGGHRAGLPPAGGANFCPTATPSPATTPFKVQCDTRTLLASIDRVSLIISEKLKSPLRCVFGDGMLSITTKTGIGDAADQCPISGDGQGLEIGFNNKYLMDALKAAPADRLRLEFTSGVAPCVILPAPLFALLRCG